MDWLTWLVTLALVVGGVHWFRSEYLPMLRERAALTDEDRQRERVDVLMAHVNNVFINEVNKLVEAPGYKEHFAGNLVTVPLEGKLGKEDFYILDGHIRPSGHRKIATEIAKYLQEK